MNKFVDEWIRHTGMLCMWILMSGIFSILINMISTTLFYIYVIVWLSAFILFILGIVYCMITN